MRIHLPLMVTSAVAIAAIAAVALFFAEIRLPAVEIDAASAVRGSLGAPLEDLSLDNSSGEFSFLLNGGFVLLSGAFACFAVVGRRRTPSNDREHVGNWPSGNSVPSI
jgi:hypothetical protein